jgi:hypothetical protein
MTPDCFGTLSRLVVAGRHGVRGQRQAPLLIPRKAATGKPEP